MVKKSDTFKIKTATNIVLAIVGLTVVNSTFVILFCFCAKVGQTFFKYPTIANTQPLAAIVKRHTQMKLQIFDIDRTLTDTKKIDDSCFVTAFQDEFNIVLINTDWTTFTNITDNGLFMELYKLNFNRLPTENDKIFFQKRFFNYLETELKANKDNFKSVDGASAFINYCIESKEHKIAFATGGWTNSAKIKLKAANIFFSKIPFTSSDNFIRRQDILLEAISQSKNYYQTDHFDKTIYFGDGEWDFKVTKELKIPFIGIDINRDNKLMNLGVERIFRNFLEPAKILNALN